jgi:hypothetical protein
LPIQENTQPTRPTSDAVDSLNKQIDEFNASRMPNMGVTPIDKRVSRVEFNPNSNSVTAFHQDNTTFLILKRETDGSFKGILKQPYHQLVGSGPDGSHSWGHILAEFHIKKGLF